MLFSRFLPSVASHIIKISVESFSFHPARSACCSVPTQQRKEMSSRSKKRKKTPPMDAGQNSQEKQLQALQNSKEEGFRTMKKLLLDVDCGVDDAQAIMVGLADPNVEILGITCVHGNTTVENVCKNVLRVLQACNKLEIPVFKGAAKSILGIKVGDENFHGQDGLGDAPDAGAPGLDLIQEENAVSAIVRIINENPGEVSLVATAPLTNLALAVRMDPTLPGKLKGLYIMGGNTESRGNTTVCGEFNFAADPEAAYVVLNDYQCETHLACWEFTCYNPLTWDFCDAWLGQDSDKARFMAKIFRHSMEESKKDGGCLGSTGFISCDSYAMAAAVDDSFVTESDHYPVTVELAGTHTRGMMIVDTLGLLKKTHKACIMKKVDMEKFKKMMMAALK
ncbi:inosine-uridine preferring nucleoside hydrolase-like isoform X2 [Poecilia reticulata]|uniref:inosine-uridine preferring nucleoside hydrolase-like isoform X2 n=1 Tax=Poecilia reticulata TaxID=8081 RepID=UPI0004A23FFE|nr:PREDICTED: inosine-uridine preferring nucleoside hydrolase-like isoform X2 [Poecilia reticulata]